MLVKRPALTGVMLSLCPLVAGLPAFGAQPQDAPSLTAGANPEVSCVPVAQRGDQKTGCFVVANKELGKLPPTPVYWHLLVYPTHEAAEKAKGELGTVVEAFGKVWLFAVADASWGPAGGQHVSRIGPLPIAHEGNYTAEYMEATFVPGMKSRAHRHPGPEAWYVVSGEQCAEIPGQKIVLRKGEGGLVPEGPPMVLWGTGTVQREGLALILRDTSRPMTLPATDWTPAGLCEMEVKGGGK
jgi:mannose-6-phosphate isomerase-like protein (cupin superfamily)